MLTDVDDRALVNASARVRTIELLQTEGLVSAVVVSDLDHVGRNVGDGTGLVSHDDVADVGSSAVLHAGAHVRSLGLDQRNGLALHVRTHQGSRCIVVLEERNQCGCDRHHLARRNVHVADFARGNLVDVTETNANCNAVFNEAAVGVELRVRLSNVVAVFLGCGQVIDLVGYLAVYDLTVRGLDEAEGVDAGEGCQRTDQTNVRAFRGLNRAHTAVVRRVNVTDFHARTVAAQATRTKRGKTTLVGHLGQRVVLVHELAQLRSSEELLQRSGDRTNVDQRLRGDGVDVLGGHAVAHDTLHAAHTGAKLVLHQLADGTQTTVAEVVDVVGLNQDVDALGVGDLLYALVECADVVDRGDDVVHGQDALVERQVQAELLVDLVPTNLCQVVTLVVEVVVVQQRLSGLARRRLTGTQTLVDVEQGLVGGGDGVLLQRHAHGLILAELLEDAILAPAESLQQDGDVLLTLAVETHADGVALVDLELQPGTARRNDLTRVDVLIGGLIGQHFVVHARRTNELGNDHALGAGDDEGTLVGHQREVANENGLALNLAGLVVHELRGDEQRRRVGGVAVLTFLNRVLRVFEAVVAEAQRHCLSKVLDGRNLFEDFFEA